MRKNNIYIIFGLFGLISLALIFNRTIQVWWADIRYLVQFRFDRLWEPYVDCNRLSRPVSWTPHPISICFVTLETRGDKEEYVRLHNANLEAYVKHQNQQKHQNRYTYLFETKCTPKRFHHVHNAYWCKFFWVRELLEEGKYDYVVWLDSDTVITDMDLDFAEVLNGYQSHWFAGLDKPDQYELLNAGVVAVRNSKQGKKILRVITETYNDDKFQNKCIKKEGENLAGIWAQTCYEQGVMNEILYKRFREYVTVLPPKYIHNLNRCEGDFITHMYGSTASARANCFRPFIPSPHEISS